MQRLSRILVVIAVTVLAVVGAVVAVPLARYASDNSGTMTAGTAAVVVRSTDLAVRGRLLLSWSDGKILKAASLGGSIVTAVFARKGQAARCGSPILEVDGKAIVAVCGRRPLWRAVTGGMTGSDVEQVVAMLQDSKTLSTTRPTAVQLTLAIKSWQKKTKMAVTGALGPQNTVWIGQPVVPSSISVNIGDVVAPGLPILTIAPHLTAARFVAENSARSADAARVVSLTGSTGSVPIDDAGTITQLSMLEDLLVSSSQSGSEPPTSIDAVSRLRTAIAVKVVPVTAIISAGAATCILAESENGPRPVPVQVVDSDIDGVLLLGDLGAGQQIVVNPGASAQC